MENSMNASGVRAVIFDVYHTLLAVEAPPGNGAERWAGSWPLLTGGLPQVTLAEFDAACRELVARDHAGRRAQGVEWPEVDWRSIVRRAVPGLEKLEDTDLNTLIIFHAMRQRHVSAMPGAKKFLTDLRSRGILTGIASNAQDYTDFELVSADLWLEDFEEDLCFLSWQQGFSKPDPGVFSWLTERLAARGISPEETLMIGDRLDNDVEPARAAGWRTWHFQGIWPEL